MTSSSCSILACLAPFTFDFNLPKRFGGTCECEGGCEFADPGPWKDPEYTRPAWWEKKEEETTIENQPSEIVGVEKDDPAVGGEKAIGGTTTTTDGEKAGAEAAA